MERKTAIFNVLEIFFVHPFPNTLKDVTHFALHCVKEFSFRKDVREMSHHTKQVTAFFTQLYLSLSFDTERVGGMGGGDESEEMFYSQPEAEPARQGMLVRLSCGH